MKTKKMRRYNHESSTFHEACGFTKEEFDKYLMETGELLKGFDSGKASVVVEAIEKFFKGRPPRHSAVFAFKLIRIANRHILGDLSRLIGGFAGEGK